MKQEPSDRAFLTYYKHSQCDIPSLYCSMKASKISVLGTDANEAKYLLLLVSHFPSALHCTAPHSNITFSPRSLCC